MLLEPERLRVLRDGAHDLGGDAARDVRCYLKPHFDIRADQPYEVPLLEDCSEALIVEPNSTQNAGSGVASYAIDPTDAERLWELSQGTLF